MAFKKQLMKIKEKEKQEKFRQLIENKYIIYNSLFLNLPNESTANTGIYIPLLHKLSKEGYENAKEPKQIVDEFFSKHTHIKDQNQKFDLLFRMVQYIERQVLLFDCIEDASFVDFRKKELQNIVQHDNPQYKDWVEHLAKFSVRLVFTAHPTQFYSDKVQGVMHQLRSAIKDDKVSEIDALLQQLAFTPFIKREKPTPFDEAQNIIYYLRYVYYETIGRLYHRISELTRQEPGFNPNLIEMGFWPGGDRDGNPFVTADTTFKVAQQLRNTVMKCYYNHVKYLNRKLTFRGVSDIIQPLKDKLYTQIFTHEVVISHTEILEALYSAKALVEKQYNGLHVADIDDFIGRVHLFGSHFATLDIRQDSSKHAEAMQQIFKTEFGLEYSSLSEAEKIDMLTNKSLQINPENYSDPITRDTLENIYQIKTIQQMNGERGLNRYIISNTENILNVLHVYALFKYCGYKNEAIRIDIVPLFETMEGMKNSESVMKQLYENQVYQQHLSQRNNSQTIMLGFSDGTKDGGYLKANWEIYRTKENLSSLSKSKGYQVVFFDGRGGPPARGGGKTNQFYASQGSEISADKIQLTIQGQTITSIYGTHEQASYNIEQLLMAGAQKLQQSNVLTPQCKDLITDLANKSYRKYTELKQHPLFTSYMEEMTTLKYYGETNIGSRPTKRKSSDKLNLKDLRAIPFVGSWSLIRQNVPGYYGVGSALETYADNFEVIEELYKNSAFFRCLILNSVMSMKKTYFPLTSYMKHDKVYGEFWSDLRNEYLLTKKWVLHLTNQKELMENELLSRLSISMREKIILPLLTIQQYALQHIQEQHPDKQTFEKLVIRSLFGNINASRNSA
jgi:phosphoenolpyruvate carboxylase